MLVNQLIRLSPGLLLGLHFVLNQGHWLDPVLDLLRAAVIPNINFNEARTKVMLDDALSNLSRTRGMVATGELIIKKGNLVSDEVYEKLTSFRTKFEAAS